MLKDGKMSKSKGNIIYPEQMIDRYGLDATKYYLLREFPFDQDMTVTPENFVNRYNGDLANDLGNLLNRTIGMINKYFDGTVDTSNIKETEFDEALKKLALQKAKETEECLDNLHYSNALEKIWQIVSASNKYIDDTKPWVLFKSEDEQDKRLLASVMANLVENLRIVAVLLQPFMEETSNKIFAQLNIDLRDWNSSHEYVSNRGLIKVEKDVEPLFVRLEVEKELEYLENIIKGKKFWAYTTIFLPVNDLRGDITGTESSKNTFKDGLKAIVDSSRQGTNMHKTEQRDTDRVVDSGGRSPGER